MDTSSFYAYAPWPNPGQLAGPSMDFWDSISSTQNMSLDTPSAAPMQGISRPFPMAMPVEDVPMSNAPSDKPSVAPSDDLADPPFSAGPTFESVAARIKQNSDYIMAMAQIQAQIQAQSQMQMDAQGTFQPSMMQLDPLGRLLQPVFPTQMPYSTAYPMQQPGWMAGPPAALASMQQETPRITADASGSQSSAEAGKDRKLMLQPEQLTMIGRHPRLPRPPSEVLRPVIDFIQHSIQVSSPAYKGKGRAVKLSVSSKSLPSPPSSVPWLLRLPATFWSRMHLYLEYNVLMRLAQVSRFFQAVRVERFAPWKLRVSFLLEHERASTIDQQRSAITLGCFICFRIRPASKFPSLFVFDTAVVHARQPYTGDRIFRYGHGYCSSAEEEAEQTRRCMDIVDHGMPYFPPPFAVLWPTPRNQPFYSEQMARRRLDSVWMDDGAGAQPHRSEGLRRYCLDCAVQTRLLKPGNEVVIKDKRYWVCYCYDFHPLSESGNCCRDCGLLH